VIEGPNHSPPPGGSVLRQSDFQPKTAFSRVSPVYRAYQKGKKGVDSNVVAERPLFGDIVEKVAH